MGMTTESEHWERVRRIAVNPYWCEGSPLAWWNAEAKIGIAHLAIMGAVGEFNLSWWLLARREPPRDVKVYVNTNLKWAIMHAPKVRIRGYTLADLASVVTLPEWQRFIVNNERLAHRLQGEGLTYSELKWLAETGSRKD